MICWLAKGQVVNYNQYEMPLSVLCGHRTTHLAPLCMVLAPVGTLGGTRGHAVVQQASASCCKGATLTIVLVELYALQHAIRLR